MADPVLPTNAQALITELGITANAQDPKIKDAVDAANAYVLRYHPEPTGPNGEQYRADHRLGAVRLAAGLYTNANRTGISDNGLGMSHDQAYRRATDVLIEQLLQIGRFAPPRIG